MALNCLVKDSKEILKRFWCVENNGTDNVQVVKQQLMDKINQAQQIGKVNNVDPKDVTP